MRRKDAHEGFVLPACPVPVGNQRLWRRDARPTSRLGVGVRLGRLTHLRPILGVKGGVGFSRDLWREVSSQHLLPPSPEAPQLPEPPRLPESSPTWWRDWRQRTRLTGGGGRPPRPRPCPHHCESGAHSLPSGTASSLPGPSGSQSGPGGSLSGSWGSRARHPGVW